MLRVHVGGFLNDQDHTCSGNKNARGTTTSFLSCDNTVPFPMICFFHDLENK